MKKLLLLSIGTVLCIPLSAQKITVTTKPDRVTVFLTGAEISATHTVKLKKGTNLIQFKNLSPEMQPKSLQIAVNKTTELLSISPQLQTILPENEDPGIVPLQDSISFLEDRLVDLMNQTDAFTAEKKMLEQNQRMGTPSAGMPLAELAKAADFFRDRTLKINTSLSQLAKQTEKIKVQVLVKRVVLDKRLKLAGGQRFAVNVTVSSSVDQATDFTIRYLVADASWVPSYDIVVADIDQPVTFRYKASVYNLSDIRWDNVKLTLSTGDVALNATRPYLTTWILNYNSSANEGYLNTWSNTIRFNADSSGISEEKTAPELSATFPISQLYTLAPDGEPTMIDLQSENLPASYEYLTVPKMEMAAFLIAKVTGWQKLNLIDGTANVYYGNAYIGESNINTRVIGDTLELSLGRDNQIVVSRSKIEDKSSTQSLGSKKSESFVYEIQLRNNHKTPVLVKIQDQLPVSQEKDITVEQAELSGAAVDSNSGRLQWIKTLGAGEKSAYRIAFTVRYPKNQTVNIRKNRMVRSPRFRK